MSSETVPDRKLLRAYKRVLVDFKLIWILKRHYEAFAYGFGDDELSSAPVDLNRVYGTLKVLFAMIQKTSSRPVVKRLESAARDIVATYHWFAHFDARLSPYDLRVYIERAAEIDSAQLKTFAKYFLQKSKPAQSDKAKADYLLARAFSWVDEAGAARISVASEEELVAEISRLLSPSRRRRRPAFERTTVARAESFLARLRATASFDELISSDLMEEARKFKKELGDDFYSARVLAKCVEFNVEMRNRFELFYREENEILKSLALTLVNTGAELVQEGEDLRRRVTLSSAIEFSRQAADLFSTDYNRTRPYLEQLSRMRDVLKKTVTIYGLDPRGAPPIAAAMESTLTEQTIEDPGNAEDEGLRVRLESLTAMIKGNENMQGSSIVKLLHLENSTLMLSSWEYDAFRSGGQAGYNVRVSAEVLKRSVALIAEIMENLALYRIHQDMPQLANPHLMKVNFYVLQAQKIADELERLSETARERNDIDAACNLSATRQKLLESCNRLKPVLERAF